MSECQWGWYECVGLVSWIAAMIRVMTHYALYGSGKMFKIFSIWLNELKFIFNLHILSQWSKVANGWESSQKIPQTFNRFSSVKSLSTRTYNSINYFWNEWSFQWSGVFSFNAHSSQSKVPPKSIFFSLSKNHFKLKKRRDKNHF